MRDGEIEKILTKRHIGKFHPLGQAEIESLLEYEINHNPYLIKIPCPEECLDIAQIAKKSLLYRVVYPQIQDNISAADKKTALQILDTLDSDGFLRRGIGFLKNDALQILTTLKTLHPIGVFSQSQKEFYQISINDAHSDDKTWQIIINNFDDIRRGKTQETVRFLGSESVMNMYIKDLENMPSLPTQRPEYALLPAPSTEVIQDSEKPDDYTVLYHFNYHMTTVFQPVVEKSRVATLTPAQKKHYKQRAKWIVKSLKTQAELLKKVTFAIIKLQKTYFDTQEITSMQISDVSDISQIHPSTISRLVQNKYLKFNHHNIPMKTLFSPSGYGDNSQHTIKQLIQNIIQHESKTELALSDKKIVECLQEKNIHISRRTVAKYRDAMGILNSTQRQHTFKS